MAPSLASEAQVEAILEYIRITDSVVRGGVFWGWVEKNLQGFRVLAGVNAGRELAVAGILRGVLPGVIEQVRAWQPSLGAVNAATRQAAAERIFDQVIVPEMNTRGRF